MLTKLKLPSLDSHLPSTVSRVTNIKIGRGWWTARWTTTSRWVTVSDDKILLTILILMRGALSRKDDREDEVGRRANLWDYQVETAEAFSLAALEMILGDIVVKVSSMMERTSIQIVT